MVRTYVWERFPLCRVELSANHAPPLGLVSSSVSHLPILVALRILMAKSASVLRDLLSGHIPGRSSAVLLTDSLWPLGCTEYVLRGYRFALTDIEAGQRTDARVSLRRPDQADGQSRERKRTW